MDQRLQAVYIAASKLFINNGYSKTQVSQIAAEANIGTGTVYNLFSGKKSILHFVLLATLDQKYLRGDVNVPVKEVDNEIIISHLRRVVDELFLQIEGKSEDGEPIQSFGDMLSTLFDYVANYHVAFSIINDNKSVVFEIEAVYRQYVNRLYKVIEENLLYYIEKDEVREIERPSLHIRNIIEGITWWAMYLPYQVPNLDLSVLKAKEIALDVLKHAYMKEPK